MVDLDDYSVHNDIFLLLEDRLAAAVWLLAKNRSVWEYLVFLDAITYGLTYHVRFVYCLCWGPPVPEST